MELSQLITLLAEERYKLIDVVKQAENEGRLYESIVTDTETYSVKTFQ